jgi:hypothetical protein
MSVELKNVVLPKDHGKLRFHRFKISNPNGIKGFSIGIRFREHWYFGPGHVFSFWIRFWKWYFEIHLRRIYYAY